MPGPWPLKCWSRRPPLTGRRGAGSPAVYIESGQDVVRTLTGTSWRASWSGRPRPAQPTPPGSPGHRSRPSLRRSIEAGVDQSTDRLHVPEADGSEDREVQPVVDLGQIVRVESDSRSSNRTRARRALSWHARRRASYGAIQPADLGGSSSACTNVLLATTCAGCRSMAANRGSIPRSSAVRLDKGTNQSSLGSLTTTCGERSNCSTSESAACARLEVVGNLAGPRPQTLGRASVVWTARRRRSVAWS